MKKIIANAHHRRNRRVCLELLETRRLLCGDNNVFGGLVADRYIAVQNTDVVEFAVMENDVFFDAYSGAKLISAVGGGSQGGRATVSDNKKTIKYKPQPNFAGYEQLTYSVDGICSATVTIQVKAALSNDYFSVPQDGKGHNLDVLRNDRFWDGYEGNRLITSVSATAGYSNVEIAPDGKSLDYSANTWWHGDDWITYIVDDQYSAAIQIRVNPALRDDEYEFTIDRSETTLNLLDNDPFWPGYSGARQITHILREADELHGSEVQITDDGKSLLYKPSDDMTSFGESIRYIVDGLFEARVHIDHPRLVDSDHIEIDVNSSNVRINVLDNDRYYSLENRWIDEISKVTSVDESEHGGRTKVSPNGLYVSYSAPSDFIGTDTFTYVADDLFETEVYVEIKEPVRDDGRLEVLQDTKFQSLRVLDNDFRGNGYRGERKITAVSPSRAGARVQVSGQRVLYSPPDGYTGDDEFTYTVDGKFEASVRLSVEPLARHDRVDMCVEPTAFHMIDVLKNDRFPRSYAGPKLITSVEILDGDAEVAIAADGTHLEFVPGTQPSARWRYTVDDKYEASASVDRMSWLQHDSYVVDQNSGTAVFDVLENDFIRNRIRNCPLSEYAGERLITAVTASEHGGKAVVSADGRRVEYAPPTDFVGWDSVAYIVDGVMQESVSIHVAGYVRDDKAIVNPGSTDEVHVLANDLFSGYLGSRKITHVTDSNIGATVKISADGRHLLYTAPADFAGTDELTYTVDDKLLGRVEVAIQADRDNRLNQFASVPEFQDFLLREALERYESEFGDAQYRYWDWGWGGCPNCGGGASTGGGDSGFVVRESSSTNVQVEGVDEGDIIEFDADYIYFLTGNDLVILDAWPAIQLHEISRTQIVGTPVSMFLDGDRVAVISEIATSEFMASVEQRTASSIHDPSVNRNESVTVVTVLDVSDRRKPLLVQRTTLEGELVDSRAKGGRVYLVLDSQAEAPRPLILPVEDPDPNRGGQFLGVYETRQQYVARVTQNMGQFVEDALPNYHSVGPDEQLVRSGMLHQPEDLRRPVDYFESIVSLVSINIQNAEPGIADAKGIYTSGATSVYASHDHFYLFEEGYDELGDVTHIFQFDWNLDHGATEVSAAGTMPGRLLNQFSADEYEDHLRVVTTFDNPVSHQRETAVFVLREDGDTLEFVGSAQEIGVGESTQSVRFAGPRAFIVTFQNVDPLFGLDLSDPTNPQVMGHLAIPGFSSYMQFIDEDRLLTVGRNTPGGFDGPAQVSLYDVTDLANPRLVDQHTMRRFSYSEAGVDHHAFGYYDRHGLLAVPSAREFTTRWDRDEDGYAESERWVNEHQLMMFAIDKQAPLGSEGGVEFIAEVTHESPVRRSGFIEDYVFSIAENSVHVLPAEVPTQILATAKDLRDPQWVVDVPPLVEPAQEFVEVARADLLDRLSISTGNVIPVTLERNGGGWKTALRIDDAYFLYEGSSANVRLTDVGVQFDFDRRPAIRQNPEESADVDGDGQVTPGDAMAVITRLRQNELASSPQEPVLRQIDLGVLGQRIDAFWDVDGDATVSAADVVASARRFNEFSKHPIDRGMLEAAHDPASVDALFKRIATSAADANLDGIIDFADFLVVSTNFGKNEFASFREGDLDGDGNVGFADFLLIADSFGRTLPTG